MTLIETKKSGDASLSSRIESLPWEITEMILGSLDMPSILSYAATNSKIRESVLPLRDEIVGLSIQTNHSWMLPMNPSEKQRWNSELQNVTESVHVSSIVHLLRCLEADMMHYSKGGWYNSMDSLLSPLCRKSDFDEEQDKDLE
jgi:hypothetical protein